MKRASVLCAVLAVLAACERGKIDERRAEIDGGGSGGTNGEDASLPLPRASTDAEMDGGAGTSARSSASLRGQE